MMIKSISKILASFILVAFGAPTLSAELPSGIVFDDGYTWYQVESKRQAKGDLVTDLGWSLIPSYRIWGLVPQGSGFKAVVSKDGEELGQFQCEGSPITDYSQGRPAQIAIVSEASCRNARAALFQGTGTYDVDVFYIDGYTFKEYHARHHRVTVRNVERVRSVDGYSQPDTPRYYVDRHAEVLGATMQLRTENLIQGPATVPNVQGLTRDNHVLVSVSLSPSEDIKARTFNAARLVCTRNGEPVDLSREDSVFMGTLNEYHVVHSDRNSYEYQSDSPYQEEIRFSRYILNLPLTFGQRAAPSLVPIDQYPGKWECTWEAKGEALRTFRWTIQADGSLASHPEEQYGLEFAPDTHMIEVEIPEGGSVVDARLVPELVQMGGFYGKEWQSDEMKSLAGTVPTRGNPWPFPSDYTGPTTYSSLGETPRDEVYASGASASAADRGWLRFLFALLFSAALIVSGLIVAERRLPEQAKKLLEPYLEMLKPSLGQLGLALIGFALFDFMLDLIALRPLIGGLFPQVTGLALGILLAREKNQEALGFLTPYAEQLKKLEEHRENLAMSAICFGLLHILVGNWYLF